MEYKMPRKKRSNLQRETPLHPAFKQIIGNVILASIHPKGFNEGLKERTILTILTKAHTWVSEQQGRAMRIANDGNNVTFLFTIDGKECEPPFTF
jgi:hypothetical protein